MKKGSFKITDCSKPENTNYKSLILRLSAVLLTVAILATILIGLPEDPLSLIVGSRKVSAVRQQLLLPSAKLSENLSVNACSTDILSSAYQNAADFQRVNSGLKVFKVRLNKEYQNGSKSLNALAVRVLADNSIAAKSTNTCLLPLKISVDTTLGTEINSPKLLEVSLGTESIICSEAKAYLSPGADSPVLYPLRQSLVSYAAQLKSRQVVQELRRRLDKLLSGKSKNKTEALKRDRQERELTVAIAHAQYFSKDGLILASFYDSICGQAAAIATPNSSVPTNTAAPVQKTLTATATGLPTSTATQIPQRTVTPTINIIASLTPTSIRSSTPTATGTPSSTRTSTPTTNPLNRIAAPTITPVANSSALPANTSQLAISWSRVEYEPGQARYLVRAIDTANPNVSILDFTSPDPCAAGGADNYRCQSIVIPNLQPGHNYRFWVHAAKAIYDYEKTDTWSVEAVLYFSLQSDSITPVYTISPTPTRTATPTTGSGGQRTWTAGARQIIKYNYDRLNLHDMSSPTLRRYDQNGQPTQQFYSWAQNGNSSFKKYIGTADYPFGNDVPVWDWTGWAIDAWPGADDHWNSNGFPKEPPRGEAVFTHRPWMANIYKHTDGTLIGFVHVETDLPYNETCRFRMGISISTDNGDNWSYVGDVIRPENADAKWANMGGTPLLIVNGYFYYYFNEFPVAGSRYPSVARAPIAEVVNAAKNNTVSAWVKYNKNLGGWTQSALNGVGSNLIYPEWFDMHTDAVYSVALGKYILAAWVQGSREVADPSEGIYLYTSSDGLNWERDTRINQSTGNPAYHIYTPPLANEENPYMFFAGAYHPDSSDDFNVIGGNEFYLFFPDRINHTFNRIPITISGN